VKRILVIAIISVFVLAGLIAVFFGYTMALVFLGGVLAASTPGLLSIIFPIRL